MRYLKYIYISYHYYNLWNINQDLIERVCKADINKDIRYYKTIDVSLSMSHHYNKSSKSNIIYN